MNQVSFLLQWSVEEHAYTYIYTHAYKLLEHKHTNIQRTHKPLYTNAYVEHTCMYTTTEKNTHAHVMANIHGEEHAHMFAHV